MLLGEIIKKHSSDFFSEIVKIRRYLHEYPELSFQELRTCEYIKKKLIDFGLPPISIAKTGVLCEIIGEKRHNKNEIILRADIDALPIQEENDISYKSKTPKVMHACGHDFHTASLLGVSWLLNKIKHLFSGKVIILFQPAEELLPGGAIEVLQDKLFKKYKPSSVIGQHVFPEIESGKIGFCPGPFFASGDEIRITIKGRGGHAAKPDKLIDPIIISSNVLLSLQKFINKNKPPLVPSILSFGRIEGLGATNVIPDTVKLEGTFRSLDESWRKEAKNKIRTLVKKTTESMGGTCDIDIKDGYPCLINNKKTTYEVMNFAKEYLGSSNVIEVSPKLYAEDFAYYSHKYPSCFYMLGVKDPLGSKVSALHTPTFNIDENALKISMGLMSYITCKKLDSSSSNH